MDVVAQHTCTGSRCDASPKNTPTDNATEGILLDCYRDAWGHGMPPNVRLQARAVFGAALCEPLFGGMRTQYGACRNWRHSMTRSARSNTARGIVTPRILAVLRFTTNSNTVGCSTGSSAGLAPFRMRAAYDAACRNIASRLGP